MIHAVLVHLIDKSGERILLSRVKRGFSAGKLNGAGGKIVKGETAEEAAVREAKEELRVTIDKHDLVKIGENIFRFKDNGKANMAVFMFCAHRWKGEPSETEELASPKWYPFNDIPYPDMWTDDIFWMPHVLLGYEVDGEFLLNADGSKTISYKLKGAGRIDKHSAAKEDVPDPHVVVPEDPDHISYPEKKEKEKAPAAAPADGMPEDTSSKAAAEQGAVQEQEEEIPNLRKL